MSSLGHRIGYEAPCFVLDTVAYYQENSRVVRNGLKERTFPGPSAFDLSRFSMIATALKKTSLASLIFVAAAAPVTFASGLAIPSAGSASVSTNLGVIKGIVKDQAGSPIADATVAIFRVGTSKLLKQVRSATDGSFIARIIPGTYTVLAVAEGFNPVTLAAIEVDRSSQPDRDDVVLLHRTGHH